ncbi:ABC transporter permease [Bacteroidales bacterium OttesenSCG-928-J19]|nr:ABC transporter permease [Bacteroidales bacterium OttesenSCG-928-J19]
MLKFLIEKEFKQIRRNSFVPKLILMMPIMVMLIFPWVANQEIKGVKLSIIDNDHSTYSQRLVQKVASSGYFSLTDVSPTYEQAMTSIEEGRADIILEIPNYFEKDLVREGTTQVMLSPNTVNGTKGNIGSSYLSRIINDFAGELRGEQAQYFVHIRQEIPQFTVSPQFRFNPYLDYKVFMIPALMVMLLTLLAGFLPALNIVGEKEAGTIEQMNVTPVSRLMFVLAKLIPYWIIGTVVITICIGLAALVYGLYPVGSLLTIFLFASIYILVVSGMGLVISNYSDTMQQAMFVIFFFIMILLLMSGLFTPIDSMPGWAQVITWFNPLKYFMEVMRLVYLKGSSFAEMIPQFCALAAFALGFSVWAIISYRKSH